MPQQARRHEHIRLVRAVEQVAPRIVEIVQRGSIEHVDTNGRVEWTRDRGIAALKLTNFAAQPRGCLHARFSPVPGRLGEGRSNFR
jgi:hypothetical protein